MSNFKNVLKVYTMMRAFDADDTALLNTLRNATEAEIDLLVETVGPIKRATRATGTIRCKAELLNGAICRMVKSHSIHDKENYKPDAHEFLGTRKSSKSPRAASLAGAIATRPKRVDDPALTRALCQHENCGWKADDIIHDPTAGYAGYHEFQSAAAQAAAGGE